jgi:transposase
VVAAAQDRDGKQEALRKQGALNPKPEQVTDPLFRRDPFFDPRDLVQVKYEMLRQVEQDGHTVSQACSSFGLSRPSFYQAQATFRQEGLPGLVRKKRGPRGRHKLTPEVLEFVAQQRQQEASLRWSALSERIKGRFGIDIHPRTLERVAGGLKKKRQAAKSKSSTAEP